jgi:hypothetical protein
MPAMDGRREVDRRELALLVLAACLLAVVMQWPLPLQLGSHIPKDLGDPLPQSWQIAWGGHALVNQPLDFFQSNQFWPLADTLAFSDALVGYAPAGLIGSGPEAAVARYDLLFLLTYALAFVGAYLLARELGIGPAGAAVAGAAFAFAPYRLEQDGHMHVIASGGIPLALAVGLRGYRRRRPAAVLVGWVIAAWQLSIGFMLGLPFAYLLAALGLIAAVVWWRRGRPALDRGLLVATLAGIALFAGLAFVLAQPYLEVKATHPEATRPVTDVDEFSGPLKILLVAPAENFIWGPITAPLRDGLLNPQEKTLFPGLLILLLAVLGAFRGPLPRALRIGLAAGAVATMVLALGFREGDGLLWPYRIVYELLPGVEGIRTPGRLVVFASLALALLAAAGAARLFERSAARFRRSLPAPLLGVGLALLIAVEGYGLPFDPFDHRAQPRVPEAPAPFSRIATPQLHLPAERADDNRRYVLWSTDGFGDMVNGRSSINPISTRRLIATARDFPDRASVAALRRAGVRSVVLHPERSAGTPWEAAERRHGRQLGEVVVYDLGPGSGPGSETGPG